MFKLLVMFFISFINIFFLLSCRSFICDLWFLCGEWILCRGLLGERKVVWLLIILIKGFKIFFFLNLDVDIFLMGVEEFEVGGVLFGVGVLIDLDWS